MEQPSKQVDELAYQVIGAAIEVHSVLGCGFLESVYEQALAIELTKRGVFFERQKEVYLTYKQEPVGHARLDFLVGGLLIVELKAIESLLPIHQAQVINYLKATGYELGLLLNFNVTKLKDNGIKRIVLT